MYDVMYQILLVCMMRACIANVLACPLMLERHNVNMTVVSNNLNLGIQQTEEHQRTYTNNGCIRAA